MESSPSHMDQGIHFALNIENSRLDMRGLFAELFEEIIKEIDQDIGRFKAVVELCSKINSLMGKENNLESMTINEIYLTTTQSRAQPQTLPDSAPLFALLDASNIPTGSAATWKQLARSVTGTNVVMAKAVGSKRGT